MGRGNGQPLLLALGSGAGGAGRTTLAMELARTLSRRNVSTVLVETAWLAPMAADALRRTRRVSNRGAGLFAPGAHLESFVEREGNHPLGILTLADCVPDPKQLLEADVPRLLERLRRLTDRVVILDLPAGAGLPWLDAFIGADLSVCVTGPESWSIRGLTPFLQAAMDRAQELSSSGLARCYLVLNGCRDAAERELGEVICHALWRKLGLYPRYLGPVDYDDRRWFHLRHGDTFPGLSSGDGPAAQVEALARRILGVQDFDERRPRGDDTEGARWMGLSETTQASELRSQYRRLWEGYRRDSAVTQVLLSESERAELISELERTYRALQMALDERQRPSAPMPVATEPAATADAEAAAPSAHELGPVEHAGQFVSRRRRAQAMSLRELSLRTKIGVRYLEAIEAMDLEALPQPLYVRGYLREIARILALPVDSLLDRYLSELAELKRGSSSGMGVQANE